MALWLLLFKKHVIKMHYAKNNNMASTMTDKTKEIETH
jgi:hypothetical protein